MKQQPNNQYLYITFLISIFMFSGCSEWQTTPVTLDQNHGLAVRHMIKSQTMYPEHALSIKQVNVFDGKKGEQSMKAYRAPVTDLRNAKEGIKFNSQAGSEN